MLFCGQWPLTIRDFGLVIFDTPPGYRPIRYCRKHRQFFYGQWPLTIRNFGGAILQLQNSSGGYVVEFLSHEGFQIIILFLSGAMSGIIDSTVRQQFLRCCF